MEPGMIGIEEPLFGGPNGHPDGLKNEQISDRSSAYLPSITVPQTNSFIQI
jgi:hypothetical protein